MIQNRISSEDKIGTFVDAGSTSLRYHTFVSEELNKKKVKAGRLFNARAMASDKGDEEQSVNFRLNRTGNVFYSITSTEMQKETKELFDSVTVLFSAMTKALKQNGKDIFNYDALGKMISKSGYFVEVQKFEKYIIINNTSVTIDTQIVQQLLPGLTSGSSLEIAKNVLGSINGQYKRIKQNEKTKLGHLLFICEELFGAASVTVRLFFATKDSHKDITSSPCYKRSSRTFEQLQEANTFLFVSPDTIAAFADKFKETPEAYDDLINRLSGFIDA